MKPDMNELNTIISLCDQMAKKAHKLGYIKTSDEYYLTYCEKISMFCEKHQLNDGNYAPYAILCKYWAPSREDRAYPSEIATIKQNLTIIKHDLFPNDYERIFISHREKDSEQVGAFIELLHAIGIPRKAAGDSESMIFCTSHPEGYIKNGDPNLEKIRSMINTDEHVFYILWYTDNYFDSPACLNEAGAIWAMKKKYQEILMPNFDSNKIRGLLDKQPVWFRANDKMRLNTFKAQIEEMFSLTPIAINAWELARDRFVGQIDAMASLKERSGE